MPWARRAAHAAHADPPVIEYVSARNSRQYCGCISQRWRQGGSRNKGDQAGPWFYSEGDVAIRGFWEQERREDRVCLKRNSLLQFKSTLQIIKKQAQGGSCSFPGKKRWKVVSDGRRYRMEGIRWKAVSGGDNRRPGLNPKTINPRQSQEHVRWMVPSGYVCLSNQSSRVDRQSHKECRSGGEAWIPFGTAQAWSIF